MVPQRGARRAPARILVIEDQPLLRFFVADELRDAGFTVIEAKKADAAKTFIDGDSDVDLIFLNVCTPGAMSGLDLARHIQAECPDVAIIITSWAADCEPDQARRFGAFIPKPYHLDHVVKLVFETLETSPP